MKALVYHGQLFSDKSHIFVPALVKPEDGVEARVLVTELPDLAGVQVVEGPDVASVDELLEVRMIEHDNLVCKVFSIGESFMRHGLHWYPVNGVAYIPEAEELQELSVDGPKGESSGCCAAH